MKNLIFHLIKELEEHEKPKRYPERACLPTYLEESCTLYDITRGYSVIGIDCSYHAVSEKRSKHKR